MSSQDTIEWLKRMKHPYPLIQLITGSNDMNKTNPKMEEIFYKSRQTFYRMYNTGGIIDKYYYYMIRH